MVDKQKCIKVAKILNLISAIVLVGFGIAGLIYVALNSLTGGKFFLVFSPIFLIMYGLLLIAAEFKIERFLKHVTFLKSFIGRGIFNIYISGTVFYYFSCQTKNDILAWISACTIFALGVIYIFMHFCAGSPDQSQNQDGASTTKEPMV